MGKRRSLIVAALLLVAMVAAAYLAYTFWVAPADDRPTLMYFRAAN